MRLRGTHHTHEHSLALEVDIVDCELVGKRHDVLLARYMIFGEWFVCRCAGSKKLFTAGQPSDEGQEALEREVTLEHPTSTAREAYEINEKLVVMVVFALQLSKHDRKSTHADMVHFGSIVTAAPSSMIACDPHRCSTNQRRPMQSTHTVIHAGHAHADSKVQCC